MEIKKLVRKNILSLAPYSTARDEYKGQPGIFLDANESPFENGYNRYPDPYQAELKKLLGSIKALPEQNIFIGNGSDEAIDLMYRIFCSPGRDNAVSISPSYGMYEVAADINDVELRHVPLNEDFSLPVDALLASADAATKLMFVCSPNNPTGNAFDRHDIVSLLRNFDGIVIVDEAYIDFSDKPGCLGLLPEYKNLVVLQTLSKAWGMAGLRCGMAFADTEIIGFMNMVKYPYNINLATMQKVAALLSEPVADRVALLKREREVLARELQKFDFVRQVYPSDANFLLVKVVDANALYEHLLGRHIIVRNRTCLPMCENCLRITVGTHAENTALLDALKEYSTQK